MRGFLFTLAAVLATAICGADSLKRKHLPHALVASEKVTVSEVVRQASIRAGTPELLAAMLAEANAMTRDAGLTLAAAPALSIRYNGDAPGENLGLKEFESLLTMRFKWPSLRAAQRRLASVAAQFAETNQLATLWRITGVARDLIWEHRTATDEVAAARDALGLAEAMKASVSLRYSHGDLAHSDVLLVESARLARERDLGSATVKLLDAQRRYAALTGLSEIPAKIEEPVADPGPIDRHPLLLAADVTVARAREDAAVQHYAGRPSPSVTVGPRWERGTANDSYADSLGVELSVPFGNNRYIALDVASAQRRVTEALVARRQIQRQLELAMHEAEHDLSATSERRENIEAWFAVASERETIARLAFDAGETSLADFLRVRLEAGTAKRAALLVKNQAGHAITRYNQALGVIPDINKEMTSR